MFLKFIKVLQKPNQNLYFLYFFILIRFHWRSIVKIIKKITHVISEKEVVAIPIVLL
jgi:hypothetical protein